MMTNMIKVSKSTAVSETVEYPDGRKVRRSTWSNESVELPESLAIECVSGFLPIEGKPAPVPLAIETVATPAPEPEPVKIMARPNRALAISLLGADHVKAIS
jgi:hypothetical protein